MRRIAHIRSLLGMTIIVVAWAAGCARNPSPRVTISSLGSLYAPSARLVGSLQVNRDTLWLQFDSVTVVMGDRAGARGGANLTELTARPLLATQNDRGWSEVSSGVAALITRSLSVGDTARVVDFALKVPMPAAANRRRLFIVVEFTGTIAPAAANARAGSVRRVRTRACADWNLEGDIRSARKRRALLRTRYLAAC